MHVEIITLFVQLKFVTRRKNRGKIFAVVVNGK